MRGLLFEQPGVLEAEIDWQRGEGWVVYDPTQVEATDLAKAVSTYFPARVTDDRPISP